MFPIFTSSFLYIVAGILGPLTVGLYGDATLSGIGLPSYIPASAAPVSDELCYQAGILVIEV